MLGLMQCTDGFASSCVVQAVQWYHAKGQEHDALVKPGNATQLA